MVASNSSISVLLLKPQVSLTQAVSVVGGADWPVTVCVVNTLRCQEQTLSGRGARVYTALRGWLGMVTGISAASTGGVLVYN